MIAEIAGPADARLGTIELLLRDRKRLIAQIASGVELVPLVKTMIATLAVSAAIVGGVLGSYRGGVQIAYAALKLPIVLLGTAALSAPALSAIGAALGRRVRLGQDVALVLAALAFGGLLLVAGTPLLLVGRAMDFGYHAMILATVALFAVGGLAALQMIVRGVVSGAGPGRWSAIAGLCVVFCLVGGQLSWALRPYLVRPRAPEATLFRELSGSLFDSIGESMDSARGIYRQRYEAP